MELTIKETNTIPDFTTVWQSKRKGEKTALRIAFCKASGEKGHSWFYNKMADVDFTDMEKDWWAKNLGYPKEQLFPS